jgi:ribonuclease BN (tRNA processing enzyme)
MFDEYSEKRSRGWGHSSNISLAHFAIEAKVGNIVMFHYNPDYTDQKIEELLNEAQKFLKNQNSTINCIPSMEGMEIKL